MDEKRTEPIEPHAPAMATERGAAMPTRDAITQLVERMRAKGITWLDIACDIRSQYRVSALVAARMAHGWSQTEAAQEWNGRWPQEAKNFQNFAYWEAWPSSAGYAPSLGALQRLAELYEVAVADLLAGVGDFRRRDPAHPTHQPPARVDARPDGVGSPQQPAVASGP